MISVDLGGRRIIKKQEINELDCMLSRVQSIDLKAHNLIDGVAFPVVGALDGGEHGDECFFFFFKQKTAYETSECDWSSDVCSSDLKQKTAYEISELQSHSEISYAVFCLKKKKHTTIIKSNSKFSYTDLSIQKNT